MAELTTVSIKVNTDDVSVFINELMADLANAPFEIEQFVLDFIDRGFEIVSVKDSVTSGTTVTVLLEPSQRLRDIGTAIRTGNFDHLLIEQPHGVLSKTDGTQILPA
jgi:hypothetical protein